MNGRSRRIWQEARQTYDDHEPYIGLFRGQARRVALTGCEIFDAVNSLSVFCETSLHLILRDYIPQDNLNHDKVDIEGNLERHKNLSTRFESHFTSLYTYSLEKSIKRYLAS